MNEYDISNLRVKSYFVPTARNRMTAGSKVRLPESEGVRATIHVESGPVGCLVKQSVVG